MHLLDTTMFFCQRGGGVKKYLLAKHEWLGKFAAPVRHTLLVPGPLPGFSDVLTCGGPSIPLGGGYRFPLGVARWRDALVGLAPDLIEAGDPYVAGIAARAAAKRLRIPVVAFCHSDLPRMLKQRLGSWIGPPARATPPSGRSVKTGDDPLSAENANRYEMPASSSRRLTNAKSVSAYWTRYSCRA